LSKFDTLSNFLSEISPIFHNMNEKSIPVYRFAPSPTGYLHVGGARTAIFNWLLARNEGGRFLLRIEDTDAQRSTDQSVQQILRSLQWLDLNWDEPPFYQSQRLDRHRQVAVELVQAGRAYYCFCSGERSGGNQENSGDKTYLYNGRCRNLSSVEIEKNLSLHLPAVIRIKLPAGHTRFVDGVHGEIAVDNSELDDFIILRSDQTPVYQLAVVVDDHDMGITHVLRGDDHLSNTPKQIQLYQALNWPVPQFSHLPLILGPDKQRLSKRHGASSVEEFREQGILPEALFNYLCLLGWSPGDDSEIMSKEELVRRFSLERTNKANAAFDQQKLIWMNSRYLADLSPTAILDKLNNYFRPFEIEEVEKNKASFLALIDLLKPRSRTLPDFISGSRFYFQDPDSYEEQAVQKYFSPPGTANLIEQLGKVLSEQVLFQSASLELIIRRFATVQKLNAGQVIHPLRLVLTGRSSSPGIFEIIEILGKEKTLRRLKRAAEYIRAQRSKT
jgi:glutamyl-tRNA synthetase